MGNYRSDDEWRIIFEAQEQSGLNQTQFCKRQRITRSAFFNAKKRLPPDVKHEDNQRHPAFISVSPPAEIAAADKSSFAADGPLILKMGHCALQFPASLSPFWLATLLRELTP